MLNYDLVRSFKQGGQSYSQLISDRTSGGIVYVQKIYKRPRDYYRELQALLELIPHKNIIGVKCAWNQTIVFERGEANLLEMRWSVGDISNLMYQMINVVSHLHSINIIHGDLKPENAVVAANGDLKLIDFGFAGRLYEMHCGFGSAGFMAPELTAPNCQPDRLTPGIDWWAVGVTAYVLYMREARPDASTLELLPFENGRLKVIPDTMPLKDLIIACLQWSPQVRAAQVQQWLSNNIRTQSNK